MPCRPFILALYNPFILFPAIKTSEFSSCRTFAGSMHMVELKCTKHAPCMRVVLQPAFSLAIILRDNFPQFIITFVIPLRTHNQVQTTCKRVLCVENPTFEMHVPLYSSFTHCIQPVAAKCEPIRSSTFSCSQFKCFALP